MFDFNNQLNKEYLWYKRLSDIEFTDDIYPVPTKNATCVGAIRKNGKVQLLLKYSDRFCICLDRESNVATFIKVASTADFVEISPLQIIEAFKSVSDDTGVVNVSGTTCKLSPYLNVVFKPTGTELLEIHIESFEHLDNYLATI